MSEEQQGSREQHGKECACMGIGPMITAVLDRFGPPEEARSHFRAARVEILKGLRAAIDKRIEELSSHQHKGTRVTVE